jgi:Protein of unknown function (DUF2786)
MADRNSIIDKIKALLSKTVENGATEAEMLSALDKASAMMDAYDITDEELQFTKDEAAMLHADPPNLKDPHKIKWRLVYGVGQFCGVQIFRSRHETGLKCIGMPSDVQFAMWLLDNLADFVYNALFEHLIGYCAPNSERRVIMRSFVERAVIASLVGCWNWSSDQTKRAPATAANLSLLRTPRSRHSLKNTTSVSAHADTRGHQMLILRLRRQAMLRGNRAAFGRPVTGAAGVLRIGK